MTHTAGSIVASHLDPAALLRAAPDAMLLVDADGVVLFANRQAEAVFGYSLETLVGGAVDMLLPPELRHQHRRHREGYALAPSLRPMGEDLELLGTRADGTCFPVEISLSPLHLDGRPLTLAAVRDVSRQRAAEQALRSSEERFRLTFASSPVGIGLLREDGTWSFVNPALCDLTGRPEAELLSMSLQDLLPEDSLDLSSGGPFERRLSRADQSTAWVEITPAVLCDAGDERQVVVHFYDITQQRSHQQELQTLALSDPLTGLPNRALLLDRTRQALARLERHPGRCALLLLDLDHFKTVNDTLGHLAGDALLRQVAARLVAAARSGDTVARLGGDEFALLCGDGHMDEAAFANRLIQALEPEYVLELEDGTQHVTRIGASIGVALSTEASTSASDLYRDADVALYEAKARGRGMAVMFDVTLRQELDRRVTQESRLRFALTHGGVRIVLQPIVDLDDGHVVAMEALARLAVPNEPELFPPSQFLPVASELGLIAALDEEVLRLCLDLLHGTQVRLHLNVSAATLEAGRWQQRLFSAIEEDGTIASRLCVELTEEALMSASSRAATSLVQMRKHGLRIGLDDFGTGYSSLSYLEQLEVDFLKLDTSLVARLGHSRRSQVLTHGIINLAAELGLRVVAEGIEGPEQAELLTSWGCERGQGYFFGLPEPAAM